MADKHQTLMLDVDRTVTLTWDPATGQITWKDADKGQGEASAPTAPPEPYMGYLKGYQDGVKVRKQEAEVAREEGRAQAARQWERSVKNYDNQVKKAKLANQRADQAEKDYRGALATIRVNQQDYEAVYARLAAERDKYGKELAVLKDQLRYMFPAGPATGFLRPEELLGRLREQGNELEQLRKFRLEACRFVSGLRNKVAYGGGGYHVLGDGIMWPEWSVED